MLPSTQSKVKQWCKTLVVLGLVFMFVTTFLVFRNRLSLENLTAYEATLRGFQDKYPLLVYLVAFLTYVAVTGLSLPFATALSLLFAWYFGFFRGVVLISFASTTGATSAFLLTRYLFRDAIQHRFAAQLKTFNQALQREGAFYLFTLRLIPAVPFFAVNVVMGLTRMRTVTFWWVSQLGMLAGTIAYVYAGSTIPTLAQINDPSLLRFSDIKSWDLFVNELTTSHAQSHGPHESSLLHGMADGVRQTLLQIESSEIDLLTRQIVVGDLNRILKTSEIQSTKQKNITTRPLKNGLTSAEEVKQRTKKNRAVLVAAFPGIVAPPQPILSSQMFMALVLLGIFPLLAKRMLGMFQRWKQTRHLEGVVASGDV
ncbi:MAG: TVP38/TMEM64 family protein [Pirellulaceae bacterium]|nr:TVP38/TMEM64 family protein [Pirellulaceae bacterium]